MHLPIYTCLLEQLALTFCVCLQVPLGDAFDMKPATGVDEARQAANNASSWSFMDVHSHPSELDKLRNLDFPTMWEGHDFVDVHLNGAVWNHFVLNHHMWQASEKFGLDRFSKRQLFEVVLQEFFSKPKPQLHLFVDSELSKLKGSFHVGLQMRFGLQWSDGKRYNGEVDEIAACFIQETIHVCRESACNGSCSVFITTDQPEAADLVSDALEEHGIQSVISPGKIVHTDRTPIEASEVNNHMKTFGDWYILTMMSKLVHSRSGFSETAAWFGNIPSRSLAEVSSCTFTDEGVDPPLGAEY